MLKKKENTRQTKWNRHISRYFKLFRFCFDLLCLIYFFAFALFCFSNPSSGYLTDNHKNNIIWTELNNFCACQWRHAIWLPRCTQLWVSKHCFYTTTWGNFYKLNLNTRLTIKKLKWFGKQTNKQKKEKTAPFKLNPRLRFRVELVPRLLTICSIYQYLSTAFSFSMRHKLRSLWVFCTHFIHIRRYLILVHYSPSFRDTPSCRHLLACSSGHTEWSCLLRALLQGT